MSTIELRFLKVRVFTGTCSASAGTQSTHAHGGGDVPLFYMLKSTGNGVVYHSATADKTNIYVKGSANSLTFEVIAFFSSQKP